MVRIGQLAEAADVAAWTDQVRTDGASSASSHNVIVNEVKPLPVTAGHDSDVSVKTNVNPAPHV